LVPVADAPEAEAAVSPLVVLVPGAAPEPSLDAGSEPLVATGEPLATPPDGVLCEQLVTRTKPAKCVMFLNFTDAHFRYRTGFPCGRPAAARPNDSCIHPFLRAQTQWPTASGSAHRRREKKKYLSRNASVRSPLDWIAVTNRAPSETAARREGPVYLPLRRVTQADPLRARLPVVSQKYEGERPS
jgi:hypothetical protein